MAIYPITTEEVIKVDSSGSEVWLVDGPDNAVAVDDSGYIYCQDSGWIQKRNPDSSLVWEKDTEEYIFSVAVDTEGNVYVGTDSWLVYKLDSDGNEIWNHEAYGQIRSIAIDLDRSVYVGTSLYEVSKIDSGGNEVWTYEEHTGFVQGLAVDFDKNVYSASSDDTVHKIDSSGNQVWVHNFSGNVSEISAEADGTVYCEEGLTVYKLDSSGDEVWNYDMPDYVEGLEVDTDGFVYVGDESGNVYKLDYSSNKEWEYTAPTEIAHIAADPGAVGAGFGTSAISIERITEIKDTEADFVGEVSKAEGDTISERGFVYGETSQSQPGDVDPASSGYDSTVNETGDFNSGSYTLTGSGLTAGTKYYVRSYIESSESGFSYSSVELEFVAGEVARTDETADNFEEGTFSDTIIENDFVRLSLDYDLDDEESFETDFGDWTHESPSADFNWERNSGTTGSSGTGPSGAYDGSYYIYVETSSGGAYSSGDESIIEYDIGASSSGYVDFYYHQYGSDQGTLYLEGWDDSAWNEIWSSTGDQGDEWFHASSPETDFSDFSKVRFRNVAAGSYRGDVALDLIGIYLGAGNYLTSGTYESSVLSTEALAEVADGILEWTAVLNGQSITAEANVSTDGGSTWEGWETISSGDSITNADLIGTNTADGLLKYRFTFSGDGSDTPELNSVTLTAYYSSEEEGESFFETLTISDIERISLIESIIAEESINISDVKKISLIDKIATEEIINVSDVENIGLIDKLMLEELINISDVKKISLIDKLILEEIINISDVENITLADELTAEELINIFDVENIGLVDELILEEIINITDIEKVSLIDNLILEEILYISDIEEINLSDELISQVEEILTVGNIHRINFIDKLIVEEIIDISDVKKISLIDEIITAIEEILSIGNPQNINLIDKIKSEEIISIFDIEKISLIDKLILEELINVFDVERINLSEKITAEEIINISGHISIRLIEEFIALEEILLEVGLVSQVEVSDILNAVDSLTIKDIEGITALSIEKIVEQLDIEDIKFVDIIENERMVELLGIDIIDFITLLELIRREEILTVEGIQNISLFHSVLMKENIKVSNVQFVRILIFISLFLSETGMNFVDVFAAENSLELIGGENKVVILNESKIYD